MLKFYFRKLVRDKVVDACLAETDTLETKYRVLGRTEFIQQLAVKIAEEAAEIPTAEGVDPEEILAELADLQTVVDALTREHGFTQADLRWAVAEKTEAKGALMKRHYVDYVVLAETSPWVDYFRANPEKYPEE